MKMKQMIKQIDRWNISQMTLEVCIQKIENFIVIFLN